MSIVSQLFGDASRELANASAPVEHFINHAKDQVLNYVGARLGIDPTYFETIITNPVLGPMLVVAANNGLITKDDLNKINDVEQIAALTLGTAYAAGWVDSDGLITAAGQTDILSSLKSGLSDLVSSGGEWSIGDYASVIAAGTSVASYASGYMAQEEAAKQALKNEKNQRIASYQTTIQNAKFSKEEIKATAYFNQQKAEADYDSAMTLLYANNSTEQDAIISKYIAESNYALENLDIKNKEAMDNLEATIKYNNRMAQASARQAYAHAAAASDYYMTKAAIDANEIANTTQASLDLIQGDVNNMQTEFKRASEDIQIASDEELGKVANRIISTNGVGTSAARVMAATTIKADRMAMKQQTSSESAIQTAYAKQTGAAKTAGAKVQASFSSAVAGATKAVSDANASAQYAFASAAANNDKTSAFASADIIANTASTQASIDLNRDNTVTELTRRDQLTANTAAHMTAQYDATTAYNQQVANYQIAQQDRLISITQQSLQGLNGEELFYNPAYNIQYK